MNHQRNGYTWTRTTNGAFISLWGDMRQAVIRERAEAMQAQISIEVTEMCPQAEFGSTLNDDSLHISIAVLAEDLAVFHQGPTHRKAIRTIQSATQRILDGSDWSETYSEPTDAPKTEGAT